MRLAGNMAGRTRTMPLAIYLGFERDVGVARALSVLLVSTLLFLALRRLERSAPVREQRPLHLWGEGIATDIRSRCQRPPHRLLE
jgi:hypothetical protein